MTEKPLLVCEGPEVKEDLLRAIQDHDKHEIPLVRCREELTDDAFAELVKSNKAVILAGEELQKEYQALNKYEESLIVKSPSEFEEKVMQEVKLTKVYNDPDEAYLNPYQEPYVRIGEKIGRNEKCPCGSGKKYKKCCLNNS